MCKNLSSVVSMWIWSIDVSGAEAADASTPAKSIVVIDSIVDIIFCAYIDWRTVRKFVLLLSPRSYVRHFLVQFSIYFRLFIVLFYWFLWAHDGTRAVEIYLNRPDVVNLRQRDTLVHNE